MVFGPASNSFCSRSVVRTLHGLLRGRHRGSEHATAGLSDFSVGVSEGSVVVVVVVGDSSGLSLSVLHAAVKPIMAMMAALANRCRNPTTSQTICCHLQSFSTFSMW